MATFTIHDKKTGKVHDVEAGTREEAIAQLNDAAAKGTLSEGRDRSVTERLARGREAAGAGTRLGTEGMLGVVGDLPDMASGATEYLTKKANEFLPEAMQPDPATMGKTAATITKGPMAMIAKALEAAGLIDKPTGPFAPDVEAPGVADIHKTTSQVIGPTTFRPENRIEQGIETGASFVPALVGGGGGAGTRLLSRVVAPTLGLEGTDYVTDQMVESGAISPETATAMKLLAVAITGGGGAMAENRSQLAKAAEIVNSSPRAVKELARLVPDPEAARAELGKLGVDANLMDVEPAALAAGMDVSTQPGAGKKIVQETMTAREKGAGGRLEEARGGAFGPEVNRVDMLAGLKDRAAEVGAKYPAAKANQTRPAVLDTIAAELDTELKTARGGMRSGLQDIRDALNQPGTKTLEPGAEGMHAIRVELDRMYEAAEPGGKLQARIGDYRKRIDSELKDIAPDIKALDEQSSQIHKEREAFETGEEVLTKKDPQSPGEFKPVFDAMDPASKQKTIEGASRYVSRQLGLSANERGALKTLFGGDWNEGKLRTLIGDEKADAFMQAMEREDTFRNTYNKTVQNSRTPEALGERGGGSVFSDASSDFAKTTAATASPSAGAKAAGIGILKNTVEKVFGGGRNEGLRAELAPLLVSGRADDLARALTMAQERGVILPRAVIPALLARQQELGDR